MTMPLQTGPCDWPLDLDCTNCAALVEESPSEDQLALISKWHRVASKILWAMSGRRIGLCDVEVRPCKKSCLDELGISTFTYGVGGGRLAPYIHNGRWFNATCGCTSDCSCGELCEVYLPGPVHSVNRVTIDGLDVDPATYRVDAPGLLTRQLPPIDASPGEWLVDDGCWPSCQDMSAPAHNVGSFVVDYRWGIEPDGAAIAAVSELTCEFLRACPEFANKDCPCKLPGNAQKIVRQGVTVDLINEPTNIFRDGRTGLTVVDMWLAAVNPHGLVAPPRVLSPDFKRPRVTTWP